MYMSLCEACILQASIYLFCSSNFGCLKNLNVDEYGFRAVSTCGVEERAGFCIEYETSGVSRHLLSRTKLLESFALKLIFCVHGPCHKSEVSSINSVC